MNLKQIAAEYALKFVSDDIKILGVGSGSTVNEFIKVLTTIKHKLDACVASSRATAKLLQNSGITVLDLNVVDSLPLYIDGADEVNNNHEMIKGGGGALVREKILAASADKFICIVDESKQVNSLGKFPVAVEVLPIARSYVAREIMQLGADPVYRQGFVSDNNNIILDVFNLNLGDNLLDIENELNCIPGVVDNGIFAKQSADSVIVAKSSGSIDVV